MGRKVVKVKPPECDVVRQRSPLSDGCSRYFDQLNGGNGSVV
jgi:crotonobetainyl-CoA:carnitine CoA-transferase CaiB-like acyl-CoA transferase